jgi:O-antigen/teichoic acid export membrane protein
MAPAALFEGTLSNVLVLLLLMSTYTMNFAVGLPTILWFNVSAGAISGVLAVIGVVRLLGPTPPTIERLPRASLLRIGIPMLITVVFGQLSNQVPLWIVAWLGVAEDAAIFGVGLQVFLIVSLPLVAVTLAGSPVAAQLNAKEDYKHLRSFTRRASLLAALPAGTVVAIMMLMGHDILDVVFGSSYRASAPIALALCAGRLVQTLTGPSEMLLGMTGGEDSLTTVTVSIACLSALASAAAFHAYGIIGVAGVSGLGFGLQGILLALAARKRLGFWPGWIPERRATS